MMTTPFFIDGTTTLNPRHRKAVNSLYYENKYAAVNIVMEEDLPEGLVDASLSWSMENEIAPTDFSEAVQATIAVSLGAISDPEETWLEALRQHDKYAPKAMTINTLHNYVTDNGPCHIWVKKTKRGRIVPTLAAKHKESLVAICRAGSKSDWIQKKDYGTRWVAYWQDPNRCQETHP